MKHRILIYGAGGLGREVAAMMIGSDTFEPAGFLDDSIPAGKVIHGLKVMGTAEQLRRMDVGQRLVVALGDPILKEQLVRRLASFNVTFQTIVHPVGEMVWFGPGDLQKPPRDGDHLNRVQGRDDPLSRLRLARRVDRHEPFAAPRQMEQAGATFEDLQISVVQKRDLPKRLAA